MIKAGLIAGAIMFVLALGFGATISPICTPCIAIFVGLLAGYLTGNFEKPMLSSDAMKRGAMAGAIAGVFAIIGQLVAAAINASSINPETLNQILSQLGNNSIVLDRQQLWLYQLGGGCCIGLFNVALLAGLGVAGASIWFSMRGNKRPPASNIPPAPYSPPPAQ